MCAMSCTNEEVADSGQEGSGDGQVDGGDGDSPSVFRYVTAGALGDEAAYITTAETLTSGTVTTIGNGLETDYSSAATWLFFGDKYLYRLTYNRGSEGYTKAFYLDSNGQLKKRSKENTTYNFTSYGIYENKIITSATAETDNTDQHGNKAYGINFCIIDVDEETTGTQTIIAEDFVGTKEYVMLSGLLEANGKIYAGVVPMGCSPYGVAAGGVKTGNEDLVKNASGGIGGGAYTGGTLSGTQYPDNCYVAVFDDATFTNPTIIQTDKQSWAAGRMRSAYYQTIWAADNGDIYVFSPSYAKIENDPRQKTTHPSSVMRIKAGANEFDSTYGPVNIEEASGGHEVYRCWHISEDYFLLQMYTSDITVMGSGTTRMAIYKGEDKTFKYVEGLPDPDTIEGFDTKNPYSEDGKCYISVRTKGEGYPQVYCIDAATATATPGLTMEIDQINAIGKLTSY